MVSQDLIQMVVEDAMNLATSFLFTLLFIYVLNQNRTSRSLSIIRIKNTLSFSPTIPGARVCHIHDNVHVLTCSLYNDNIHRIGEQYSQNMQRYQRLRNTHRYPGNDIHNWFVTNFNTLAQQPKTQVLHARTEKVGIILPILLVRKQAIVVKVSGRPRIVRGSLMYQ